MVTQSTDTLPMPRRAALLIGVLFGVLVGLSANRILYEWAFPRATWLDDALPLLVSAVLGGAVGWSVARRLLRVLTPASLLLVGAPLLLTVGVVVGADPSPVASRLLFFGSIWLLVALGTAVAQPGAPLWVWLALLVAALAPLYLATLGRTVGSADTFEFQVVAPQLGIAHPTGYPLFLLLGKLWTLLPAGSAAWRLNLGVAVYAVIASALVLVLVYRLFDQPLPALLAGVAFGTAPTLWSQAVAAEVYTLNAMLVAAALLVMVMLLEDATAARRWWVLACLIGLGMTNHITTLLLLPAAGLTALFARVSLRTSGLLRRPQFWLGLAGAFVLPLLFYAYLPLRWQAVNGEPMGFGRFLDWVTGSRFQGALQLTAWLQDPARYGIVGRLFSAEWTLIGLLVIAAGAVALVRRRRRGAVLLSVTWLAYTFYALNYYVPDLAVFLIPAHLILAILIGAALVLIPRRASPIWRPALFLLLAAAGLLRAPQTWRAVDQSADNPLVAWGEAVLGETAEGDKLAADAAILADSEKIAPLYYLQQAEGVRPDLDIMVLPDEAAYRAELSARLGAGQPVYLARYLPRLPAALRSHGPLAEVVAERNIAPPEEETLAVFDGVSLIDVSVSAESPYDPTQTAVTLTWQATGDLREPLLVSLRWLGPGGPEPATTPQHPVNNLYPTAAWQAGERVTDFYHVPRPLSPHSQTAELQVALAPAFTPVDEMAWQTVAEVALPPASGAPVTTPLRIDAGSFVVDGAHLPDQIRPNALLPVTVTGFVREPGQVVVHLVGADGVSARTAAVRVGDDALGPFGWQTTFDTAELPAGRYRLVVPDASCGWVRGDSAECLLATVAIDGMPLPQNATNFDDKIALLEVETGGQTVTPDGTFDVTFTWQALAPLTEDYTVFVQLLDENDAIVGQVDAWPVQGTRPTSGWQPGDIVVDPHVVPLPADLPPGPYRLIAGWYLLATAQRLPVLDDDGNPIDDKIVVLE